MNILNVINEFVNYGLDKKLITDDDIMYVINTVMGKLKIRAYDYSFDRKEVKRKIDEILDDLINYAKENKIIGEYLYERDLFDTMLMDIYTPMPSHVINKFNELYKLDKMKATDYFYKLMCDVNYVRCERIAKNISFDYKSKYGNLLITINLSKPEKDPKDIALAKLNTNNISYPKCAICYENIGYFGNEKAQARNNIRVIPLKLNGENFYFQYSPYAYYNEHSIIFKREHEDMKISDKTFKRLLDFVEMYPHYFIGSNADLPIVGGSILTHEHYQGGRFEFPLDKASIRYETIIDNVKLSYLNWPLDCLRLTGENKNDVLALANKILIKWKNYSNPKINIIAYDTEPHNTITPIARMVDNKYVLNLVLRNNLKTEKKPYGLYHPDESLHHIKKENIGLIEVMGLAILPGRLKKELALFKDILEKKEPESRLSEIEAHRPWYDELKGKNINLNDEIGKIYSKVLEDCGVFKYGKLEDVIEFITSLNE